LTLQRQSWTNDVEEVFLQSAAKISGSGCVRIARQECSERPYPDNRQDAAPSRKAGTAA
jgi:hypothetical protein